MENIKLGPNEFYGICMKYGVPTDEGDIFLEGSLANCTGRLVAVHHEHNVAIGIARLTEAQGLGIAAHGRIAVLTATGLLVAVAIQQGFLKQFCLSTEHIRGSQMTLPDGRRFIAVHEAESRELSICLRGGIPGTGIQQWGGLRLTQTDWDKKFYPDGAEILNSETAHLLQFFADVRKKNTNIFDREKFNEWITTMSF
ncbi:MAG: hypothetical protein ABSC60_09150 [Acidobacteriota bacterium]|jgi:hypothetical protein